VASPQLRNQGTIGGNLCQKPRCWYYRGEFHCLRKGGDTCFAFAGENLFHCILGGDRCYIVHPSDTAPALVALEAVVRVRGPLGDRRVPLEVFHVLPSKDPRRDTVLEPGEIVTEVVLPPPPEGLVGSYRKVRARRSWDFALAGVALALAFEGDRVSRARIVLGGAAPVPWRSREAEEVVTGRRIDAKVAARAGEAAMENAQPLDQNGYKVPLFRGVIEEELLAAAARAA
jgi:xanthine dehydrogenase YagS FAD-binding subunit